MRRIIFTAAAALAISLGGCGDDDASIAADSGAAAEGELVVSAATSLKAALTDYGNDYDAATVRLSFAGSDQLAAQIRQGVRPDVFASANTKLPDALFSEGLVEQPVVFAGNRLVIAVPRGSTKVSSLGDLAASGVKIAAGSASVPVGAYTRKVLSQLPASERNAILGNVRSSEPDVGGVVGKLTQGAVDAGFVYRTDVTGAGGALKGIELPAKLEPDVAYGVAVVKGAEHEAAARAFVDGLLGAVGQEALTAAGFAPAPK
ncbi:MAG: molybdate ABC transporter substrate-binding protein [Solirubrobacteraceae bacterium]|nr:molybdate ABC transporter substrate-binding protein [Solirubrobacteraceae bacterium]